jgi:hypothetical protein
MKMSSISKYTTNDFYLASFLLTKGVKIFGLDRNDPRKVNFVFGEMEGTEKLVEDFLFGKAKVDPKQFVASIRELKQLLYSNG